MKYFPFVGDFAIVSQYTFHSILYIFQPFVWVSTTDRRNMRKSRCYTQITSFQGTMLKSEKILRTDCQLIIGNLCVKLQTHKLSNFSVSMVSQLKYYL